MPTLSSILVQRGASSMRAVEDAIARQVFHGGDLPTNLLEQGAVREELLTPILAESFGMDPGPLGRLPPPSAASLRVLPGDLALRHLVFPLGLEARTLLVATAEPLGAAVEEDLAFALALGIRQVIVPAVRVRQAIADHYGIPLERRWIRLLARLDGAADPSPSAAPPAGSDLSAVRMPRPVSIPSPSFGTGVQESEPPAKLDTRPPLKTLFSGSLAPSSSSDAAPARAPTLAGPPAVLTGEADATDPAPQDLAMPAIPRSPALPRDAVEEEPAAASPEPAKPPSAPPADAAGARALAGLVRQALRDERATAPVDKTADRPRGAWRPAPRRRGPFTTAMAERELEDATTSDTVLEVVFAFAHQFFEYAALFVVHGDLAEGRDATGPGADRARVAGIGVPLDQPSSLASTRERRALLIAPLAEGGLDAELARDLGRVPIRPHAVAFLPLLVRNRVVAIVYGDHGEDDVQLAALGEVLSVMGLASAALERIALRKKLGGKAPLEVPVRVKIQEGGAAALARAITASAMQAVAPPPAAPPPAAPEPRPDLAAAAARRTAPTVPAMSAVDESFSFSPPEEESPLGVTPVPRTQRTPTAQPHEGIPSLQRRAQGIQLMDGGRSEPVAEGERAAREGVQVSPAAHPTPSPGHRPGLRPDEPPFAPGPTRRGLAPIFEGRAARAPAAISLEPLPSTPPPNATAWTSFPSDPPPNPSLAAVSLGRTHSDPPIPREEIDSSRAPVAPPVVEETPLVTPADPAGEYQALVNRAIEGGRAGQEAFDELVRSGDLAVQAVMSRFPGPLRVDRHRARAELPAASQCGPILELCVAIRRPALPFVSVRSSSPDPEVRFWATHVLGELRYPEAASVLLPRLFDDDASVRRIARRSAASLVNAGSAGAPILRGLDDIVRNRDQPAPHRALAIETMGEIRAGSMVPPLLAALDDVSADVADSARRALMLITRQDHGKDTLRWRDWWDRNGTRHRIEWLIDALMNEQPSLRRAAGDELKQLTKEYFGYYDDLPKRERERAQALYRSWWEREGRGRFA